MKSKWEICHDYGAGCTSFVNRQGTWQVWRPYSLKTLRDYGGEETDHIIRKHRKLGHRVVVQTSRLENGGNYAGCLRYFKNIKQAWTYVRKFKANH